MKVDITYFTSITIETDDMREGESDEDYATRIGKDIDEYKPVLHSAYRTEFYGWEEHQD